MLKKIKASRGAKDDRLLVRYQLEEMKLNIKYFHFLALVSRQSAVSNSAT